MIVVVSNRQILIYFLVVLDFSTHEFVVKKVTTKTGKNAGSEKFTVKLIIPPFTFRKKDSKNFIGSKAIFCCTGCEKESIQTIAHAILNNLDENGRPCYSLSKEPVIDSHGCRPSPVQHLVKLFSDG